jgi:hypothetical protein
MLDVDDIVEHDATIGMRGLDNFQGRAQRGDDDGHLVLHADFHVLHQPVIGDVTDLVDGVGRDFLFRMPRRVFAEFVFDARQPLAEFFHRARIQRRKRTDDTGLALGDDQFRPRDDEQRRADHGQLKSTL